MTYRTKTPDGTTRLTGVEVPPPAPPVDDTGWVNIAMNSPWASVSGYTMQYRRIDARVQLRGVCQRPSGTIATVSSAGLPAGCRPATQLGLLLRMGSDYVVLAVTVGGSLSVGSGYTNGLSLYFDPVTFLVD